MGTPCTRVVEMLSLITGRLMSVCLDFLVNSVGSSDVSVAKERCVRGCGIRSILLIFTHMMDAN